jgi:hypothetical protein
MGCIYLLGFKATATLIALIAPSAITIVAFQSFLKNKDTQGLKNEIEKLSKDKSPEFKRIEKEAFDIANSGDIKKLSTLIN